VSTLREHLREAPFGLAMSSGFFSFFAHTGFLTVLEDEGLLPARLSGSSAGALVGAAWAAGLDAPLLAAELERLQRSDFWDPGLGPGLLRGRLFRERLDRLLPRATFDRGRAPAAVSVFEVRSRKTRVLDRGEIAAAIHASCAVPFMFHPVVIEGRAYLDGGILDRPGLEGMPLSQDRVLFHHIASRSPWRSREGAQIPKRKGMVTLVLSDLPRSGPFKLDEGRRAYRVAKEATKRALDRTIPNDGVVVVS
jgi:NTE family protein